MNDWKPEEATLDELLTMLPYYWGMAWAMACESSREHHREMRHRFFYTAPHLFALANLARKHPEEFEQLVDNKRREAFERYGGDAGRMPLQDPDEGRARMHNLMFPEEEEVIRRASGLVQDWEVQDGFSADRVYELQGALHWMAAVSTGVGAGPYSWGPCCYCGRHGDEGTMDPLSGGEQGHWECIERDRTRGRRPDDPEVIDRGEVDL